MDNIIRNVKEQERELVFPVASIITVLVIYVSLFIGYILSHTEELSGIIPIRTIPIVVLCWIILLITLGVLYVYLRYFNKKLGNKRHFKSDTTRLTYLTTITFLFTLFLVMSVLLLYIGTALLVMSVNREPIHMFPIYIVFLPLIIPIIFIFKIIENVNERNIEYRIVPE